MVEKTSPSHRYKEYEGDVDIFIPTGKEQQYLTSHGIELHRFDNGAILAGATRTVSDKAYAQIVWNFPVGAFYEPSGKSGINHLIEHLISNKPGLVARRHEAGYNAITNHSNLTIILKGSANPAVRDYGIWPAIPVISEQISTPFLVSSEMLDQEKKVVAGEIIERHADHEFVVGKFFKNIVYREDNPFNYETIGSEEDLQTITPEDIQRQHEALFAPRELEVAVFSEGTSDITRTCMKSIDSTLRGMKNEHAPFKVDEELYERIHPDFHQGSYYAQSTGIPNGRMTVHYVWLHRSIPFTASTYATTRFMDIAGQKAFTFFRENGLGYSFDKIDQWLGWSTRLLGFSMAMRAYEDTEEFVHNLYPQLMSAVFTNFGKADTEHITKMAKRRLSAVPVSVESRFHYVMYGLRHYGRIIDADKLNDIDKQVSSQHLEQIQRQLIATPPAMIVAGDI